MSIEILSIRMFKVDHDPTGQGGSRVAWMVSIGPSAPLRNFRTNHCSAGVGRGSVGRARGNGKENPSPRLKRTGSSSSRRTAAAPACGYENGTRRGGNSRPSTTAAAHGVQNEPNLVEESCRRRAAKERLQSGQPCRPEGLYSPQQQQWAYSSQSSSGHTVVKATVASERTHIKPGPSQS